MLKTTSGASKPVIPDLKTPEATKGLPCSKHLKDSYDSADALLKDLGDKADALMAESAAVYLDGRILFPVAGDGTTIDFGRVWHEREARFILASVGNSAYVTDKNGKVTR